MKGVNTPGQALNPNSAASHRVLTPFVPCTLIKEQNQQISLDNNIITFIEEITKEQHKTRSAVIREAINYWIKYKTINKFESQWIRTLQEEEPEYNAANDEAWMDAEQWDES